jgi:hypothetical protein
MGKSTKMVWLYVDKIFSYLTEFLDIDDDEVQTLLTKLKSRIDQWGGQAEGQRIKLVAVVSLNYCFIPRIFLRF